MPIRNLLEHNFLTPNEDVIFQGEGTAAKTVTSSNLEVLKTCKLGAELALTLLLPLHPIQSVQFNKIVN